MIDLVWGGNSCLSNFTYFTLALGLSVLSLGACFASCPGKRSRGPGGFKGRWKLVRLRSQVHFHVKPNSRLEEGSIRKRYEDCWLLMRAHQCGCAAFLTSDSARPTAAFDCCHLVIYFRAMLSDSSIRYMPGGSFLFVIFLTLVVAPCS